MLDWFDVPTGVERDFNGLEVTRWGLGVSTGGKKSLEMPAYHPGNVARKYQVWIQQGQAGLSASTTRTASTW